MSEYQITIDSDLIQDFFTDGNAIKTLMEEVLNQILEAQQTEQIRAGRYERTDNRRGHRNGTRSRTINSRVGKLSLEVPQTHHGNIDTEMFKRYQRSEQALLLSLMERKDEGTIKSLPAPLGLRPAREWRIDSKSQKYHRGFMWKGVFQIHGK